MKPSYECSPAQLDLTDRLRRDDLVSWRLDGEQRQFGRVVRMTTRNFQRAFVVRGDGGVVHIVPAKYITKEVG